MERKQRDNFATTEVIRPAAVLMEEAARRILAGLAENDVQAGGVWWTTSGIWRRFDRPWPDGADDPGPAVHLGTTQDIQERSHPAQQPSRAPFRFGRPTSIG